MANPDCSGNYTYYDYRNFPLQWYELNARMNPSLPAGEDNVSVHHRIRYGIAGGQRGIESLDSGLKLPWLYVHGGPGGGFSPDDHRMVDPDIYVPIMVVQRGSAGSGHEGNMQDVSVAHFIIDYVDVLAHLGISKAHFSGGSWGTTLVLKLLLEHPQLFMKLPTLRGLWIPSEKDLQFGYSRLNTHFPNHEKEQQAFFGFIAEQEDFFREHAVWNEVCLRKPDDLPFAAFHFMINGSHTNSAVREEAARRMWRWELISAKADPSATDLQHIEEAVADKRQALGFAATICHFHANRFFLEIGDDFESCEIWQRRGELASMGLAMGDLVQGADDSLCRPEIAVRWAAERTPMEQLTSLRLIN